jgi:cytochrome c peroxidase
MNGKSLSHFRGLDMNDPYLFSRHAGGILLVALALFLGSSFLLGDCHAGRTASSKKEYSGTDLVVRIFFKPLPKEMPGSHSDTPEMIELGRKLFFERDISLTRSQACNDCHRLDNRQAGVDHLPTSKGAMGISGKRNAPTVLNAGFQAAQFWDGRSDDLVEQAKGPLLNPIEMAMRTERDVVNRLKSSEDFLGAFQRAFPYQTEPITFDNAARAIAAFERTLITPSRFDRYLRGETKALTRAERIGLERFVDVGCIDCHSSHPVGGRLMRKLGIYHPYENPTDTGRHTITGLEEDRFVFKVCMLRNVTLTAPYFHDGQVSTLPEAVRLMAWMQLDKVPRPKEIDDIVLFLRTLEAEHLTKGH